MTPASETLAAWGLALRAANVPARVLTVAREHVLDTLGCGLAAHAVGQGTAGQRVALDAGADGPATLLGTDRTVPAPAAALANGMLCHGLDFDDTHEASIAHIATVVVPAALAAAQETGADGEAFLTAVVAGTEAVARIGMAAPNGFHARGFHPTGVCGIFGATLVACRLRGAGLDETVRALGLAGSMGSGIFEYLADGSATKPLHAGWAAQAGLMASALAAAGGEGPATVLEGRFGLYATHVDSGHDVAGQLADLGDREETERVALKPYPACHWIHAAVDAAVEAADGAAPEDIERVVLRIPDSGVPIVLEPHDAKWRPVTAYDAKFSLPWCAAARLARGRLDVRSFVAEDVDDPAVLALADRIEAAPWRGAPATSPFAGAAEVTVGGTTREARHESPRGSAERPMTREEVEAKFRGNASLALSGAEQQAVVDAVDGLGAGTGLDALAAALRVPAQQTLEPMVTS